MRKSYIGVITRTKNREFFLKRVYESLQNQSFKSFDWIIVNDGGDPNKIESVINEFHNREFNINVIHIQKSLGMENASNVGVKSTDCKYIHIHDDDDTLCPEFYQTCFEFLEDDLNCNYKGVITHTYLVKETLKHNKFITNSKSIYNPNLFGISIGSLCKGNLFPPISFLFKRSLLKDIGYFDVDLKMRGDWDFNLRVIEKFNIGVIPISLANWHHRKDKIYGNSVIVNKNLHLFYDSIIRNKYFRRDLELGISSIGYLLAMYGNNNVFNSKKSILTKFSKFLRFLK